MIFAFLDLTWESSVRLHQQTLYFTLSVAAQRGKRRRISGFMNRRGTSRSLLNRSNSCVGGRRRVGGCLNVISFCVRVRLEKTCVSSLRCRQQMDLFLNVPCIHLRSQIQEPFLCEYLLCDHLSPQGNRHSHSWLQVCRQSRQLLFSAVWRFEYKCTLHCCCLAPQIHRTNSQSRERNVCAAQRATPTTQMDLRRHKPSSITHCEVSRCFVLNGLFRHL